MQPGHQLRPVQQTITEHEVPSFSMLCNVDARSGLAHFSELQCNMFLVSHLHKAHGHLTNNCFIASHVTITCFLTSNKTPTSSTLQTPDCACATHNLVSFWAPVQPQVYNADSLKQLQRNARSYWQTATCCLSVLLCCAAVLDSACSVLLAAAVSCPAGSPKGSPPRFNAAPQSPTA